MIVLSLKCALDVNEEILQNGVKDQMDLKNFAMHVVYVMQNR